MSLAQAMVTAAEAQPVPVVLVPEDVLASLSTEAWPTCTPVNMLRSAPDLLDTDEEPS